jgi:hypothetical protein
MAVDQGSLTLPYLLPEVGHRQTSVHHWRFFVCGITWITGPPIPTLSPNYPPTPSYYSFPFFREIGRVGGAIGRDAAPGLRFRVDHLRQR